MLDLTLTQKKDYEVKWVDGEILAIPAPSQFLYKKLAGIVNVKDNYAIIDELYDLANMILNANKAHKEVDAGVLPLDTCALLLRDYLDFFQMEMEKQVVFQSTQQVSR